MNEDGTLNSPANPARRGTTVTLPANGFDPSAIMGFGGIVRFSVTTGKFPGIPGEIPLIRATIDPNLPATIQNLTLLGSTFPSHMPVSLAVGGPGSPAQCGAALSGCGPAFQRVQPAGRPACGHDCPPHHAETH